LTSDQEKRKKEQEKLKEMALLEELAKKEAKIEVMKRERVNAQGFNSTTDRDKELNAKTAEVAGLGPGSYNPINRTIMEKYIKAREEGLRRKERGEDENRVYGGVLERKGEEERQGFYDKPGAFDDTLKKAHRTNFINQQTRFPSSFGSCAKRF
jgi:hypothetical protein